MYPIPANATRIRYLESTGTQYVDTGDAVNTATDDVRISFQLTGTTNWRYCFGSFETNAYFGVCRGDGSSYFAYYNQGLYRNISYIANSRHEFVANSNGAKIDNNQIASFASFSATANVFLFSLNRPGNTNDYKSQTRIWSYRHWRNGTLVRSVVPVRIGSSGYLYDRVSGRLFGNAADNNAGFPTECCGPDTFAQGVIPTRMMAMGVRKKVTYPWDYRVEYFEIASGTPRFLIPKIPYFNSNIDDSARLTVSQNLRSINIVSCPAGARTGDVKLCGGLYRCGVARYSSKWRPVGFSAWPTQPTETEFPFVADVPIKFEQWYTGYTYSCSANGKTFTKTISQSRVAIDRSSGACSWVEGANDSSFHSPPNGTRWYRESAVCSDLTYGFSYDFVPCVMNGTPAIYDIVNGTTITQSGSGTIVLGPRCKDDFDPMA